MLRSKDGRLIQDASKSEVAVATCTYLPSQSKHHSGARKREVTFAPSPEHVETCSAYMKCPWSTSTCLVWRKAQKSTHCSMLERCHRFLASLSLSALLQCFCFCNIVTFLSLAVRVVSLVMLSRDACKPSKACALGWAADILEFDFAAFACLCLSLGGMTSEHFRTCRTNGFAL